MINKILKYYSFIIVTVLVVTGFATASTIPQLISAIVFYPLAVYFWLSVLPKRSKAINLIEEARTVKVAPPSKSPLTKLEKEAAEELAIEGETFRAGGFDIDRRAFIKLIGSAGISVFLLSIFTKRAQAAFFGSVPGPGIVGVKDSSGNLIDPAEKHPTDGYNIVQLDDAVPAFYGFQNKSGAWFIMQEDASGNYRYAKGASDFTNATTGWPNRASLTYDYFENVF